jgi:heptosyltransferase I
LRILVVKLSSLGDVVHAMPAVQDMLEMQPDAQIDWVVEEGFADLARLVAGVRRVIPIAQRRWRKEGYLASSVRRERRAFKADLQSETYDLVIDFQGLLKSALVARSATLAEGGKRIGLGNKTEGSSYEGVARLAYSESVILSSRIHAIERSRELAAVALGYPLRTEAPEFGMRIPSRSELKPELQQQLVRSYVVLVHGTSRADKQWPMDHWVEIGRQLAKAGLGCVLPWGNDEEYHAARFIADNMNRNAVVLSKLSLPQICTVIARSVGVVGVDSGITHIASALARPTVQIYNFDTAWRTGGYWSPNIVNIGGVAGSKAPAPPQVDEVLSAFLQVLRRPNEPLPHPDEGPSEPHQPHEQGNEPLSRLRGGQHSLPAADDSDLLRSDVMQDLNELDRR